MIFGPGKSPFKVTPLKEEAPVSKGLSGRIDAFTAGKYTGYLLLTLLFTTLVYFQDQAGEWFKASVLEAPAPFNGTTLPVTQVPDWTHWGGDADIHYSQVPASMLVDLPPYNLNTMSFPNDDLIWGNHEHDIIRNVKITYPVVYLGNYELDHVEGSGSHLAVDIKMPIGTPVHAISNGKVVKVKMIESGFGHHVVIKHINAPDPANPGKTTTLYSAFNHMDEIHVSEGQNVSKGQIIGTSGNTGTSTTPHLHFQIDREEAPWHPYWPFSWAESQAASLSFFEAVNAGLGVNKAKQYTINPMQYVVEHINFNNVVSANTTTPPPPVENPPVVEIVETPTEEELTPVEEKQEVEVLETPETANRIDTSLFTFGLSGEATSLINNGVTLIAIAEESQIQRLGDNDEIRVELEGVGRLLKSTFRKNDFKSGTIKIIVNSSEPGISNVLIGKNGHQIRFIDKVEGVAKLRVEHDGYFQKNTVEPIDVVALDSSGNVSPAVSFTGVINLKAEQGSATFNPSTLEARDFKNGKARVRVTVPNESDLVIRAQNGAILGISEQMKAQAKKTFTDVSPAHPNYNAIQTLQAEGVINGYPDGTFQPEKTVNRAEALKMLMGAFNISNGPASKLSFSDIQENAWYSSYLASAVDKGIVAGYFDGTFRPANTVNKAEYLKMLFETNEIKASDKITANPYADVPKDAWYAPYAYIANRKNILEVAQNRLRADQGMTRADVAETIYRLKHILDNGLLTYAK